jgi:hypothetical protein
MRLAAFHNGLASREMQSWFVRRRAPRSVVPNQPRTTGPGLHDRCLHRGRHGGPCHAAPPDGRRVFHDSRIEAAEHEFMFGA